LPGGKLEAFARTGTAVHEVERTCSGKVLALGLPCWGIFQALGPAIRGRRWSWKTGGCAAPGRDGGETYVSVFASGVMAHGVRGTGKASQEIHTAGLRACNCRRVRIHTCGRSVARRWRYNFRSNRSWSVGTCWVGQAEVSALGAEQPGDGGTRRGLLGADARRAGAERRVRGGQCGWQRGADAQTRRRRPRSRRMTATRGPPKDRKKMAIVGAVYDAQPQVRTAEQVLHRPVFVARWNRKHRRRRRGTGKSRSPRPCAPA